VIRRLKITEEGLAAARENGDGMTSASLSMHDDCNDCRAELDPELARESLKSRSDYFEMVTPVEAHGRADPVRSGERIDPG
jgi:hypothetical protein